jgi:hypothetical protein
VLVVQVPPWQTFFESWAEAQVVGPQVVPLATALQVPALPDRLHDLQALVQVVSQQTPSTQCPEAQAASLVPQAEPRGSWLTHVLPTHW